MLIDQYSFLGLENLGIEIFGQAQRKSRRLLRDRMLIDQYSFLGLENLGIEIFGQAQRKALRLLLDGLPLDALESCPAAVMLLSRTVGR